MSRGGGSRASADAPFSREGEGGAESSHSGRGTFLLSTVIDVARFVWGSVSVVDDVVFV